MRGGGSSAKLTSCHAVFFPWISVCGKLLPAFIRRKSESPLFWRGREVDLARRSCVCEQWEFGFSASLRNLIFSVTPGWLLLFSLEKLSFFIGVLTPKLSGPLTGKKKIKTGPQKWILSLVNVLWLLSISYFEPVKMCPSNSYWYKTKSHSLSMTAKEK